MPSRARGEGEAGRPGAPRSRRVPGRRRDPARSRAAILAAATAEFSARGLGGARVDEIASAAGVNKSLLYHYFGGKEDLFLAVLEEAYAQIRHAEGALRLEALEPREAMERLVDFTWSYFVEHPEFISLLNSENLHRARHLARSSKIRALHHPLVERIDEILERGARTGHFRGDVDAVQLYVSIAALGYFYLSNAWTLGTVFERDLRSADALEARRQHVQAVVQGYLRPEASR